MTTSSVEISEQVLNALEIGRYNPEAVEILEQCVEEQVQKKKYNLEANLALLKLYQFSPGQRKTEVYCKIFALALLKQDDFIACFYMLPSALQNVEPFVTLQKLAEDLESANFREFWVRINVELFKQVKDFKASARNFISDMLSLSYQQIPVSIVASSLGYPVVDEELTRFLLEKGWVLENDAVHIPSNNENKPRGIKFEESIQLHQVAPLFRLLET